MDNQERARLGARLRQARRDAGRSQEDVARAAGVSPNTLMTIEAGRKVRDSSIRAVAVELGIESSGTFPADVEVVRDMIGEWLLMIPPTQRSAARRALARFMASWAAEGDADLRRHISPEGLAQIDEATAADERDDDERGHGLP